MKTTITTREYDEEGRLTREIVTEYEPQLGCTCGSHTWCQLHHRYVGPMVPTWTPTIWSAPQVHTVSNACSTDSKIKIYGEN